MRRNRLEWIQKFCERAFLAQPYLVRSIEVVVKNSIDFIVKGCKKVHRVLCAGLVVKNVVLSIAGEERVGLFQSQLLHFCGLSSQ